MKKRTEIVDGDGNLIYSTGETLNIAVNSELSIVTENKRAYKI